MIPLTANRWDLGGHVGRDKPPATLAPLRLHSAPLGWEKEPRATSSGLGHKHLREADQGSSGPPIFRQSGAQPRMHVVLDLTRDNEADGLIGEHGCDLELTTKCLNKGSECANEDVRAALEV